MSLPNMGTDCPFRARVRSPVRGQPVPSACVPSRGRVPSGFSSPLQYRDKPVLSGLVSHQGPFLIRAGVPSPAWRQPVPSARVSLVPVSPRGPRAPPRQARGPPPRSAPSLRPLPAPAPAPPRSCTGPTPPAPPLPALAPPRCGPARARSGSNAAPALGVTLRRLHRHVEPTAGAALRATAADLVRRDRGAHPALGWLGLPGPAPFDPGSSAPVRGLPALTPGLPASTRGFLSVLDRALLAPPRPGLSARRGAPRSPHCVLRVRPRTQRGLWEPEGRPDPFPKPCPRPPRSLRAL